MSNAQRKIVAKEVGIVSAYGSGYIGSFSTGRASNRAVTVSKVGVVSVLATGASGAFAALPAALSTGVDTSIADVSGLATTVVVGLFALWAIFMALKARK